MEAPRAERVRTLLRQELDWDYLGRLAFRHGMRPLLYWHFNAICPEIVPKANLDALRDSFYATARYNLFLTGELLKLLKLFEAHNIPALPFKGPALASLVYGNLSLRDFSDLDILVHKRNVLRAKALLISHGYRLSRQLTGTQEAIHLQSFHAYTLVRDNGRINVDLHWRFAQSYYSFPLDPEYLWERLTPVPFAGTTILHLPPEDLLLILCMHGAKDSWARLLWLCDLAELIRAHRQMDWGWIMEQARTLRSERKLLLGLCLASDLLGAALPEGIVQKVQTHSVIKSLAVHVRESLFSAPDSMARAVENMALHLRVADRWRDRVPYLFYCLRLVVTPNTADQALLTLPIGLSFLYYLLRPIRLVRTYGLRPWKETSLTPTKPDGVGATPR
jgi:hypothetical protein